MSTITDTQRIEALARSLNMIIVYDGTNCSIRVESGNEVELPKTPRQRRRKIRKGLDVTFLRDVLDGLVVGDSVNESRQMRDLLGVPT